MNHMKYDRYTYRGRMTSLGKWMYGAYVLSLTEPHIMSDKALAAVDPVTVGLCADMPDKNGATLFEGDICCTNGNQHERYEICYGEFKVYNFEDEEVQDFAVGWYMKVIPTSAFDRCEPFCFEIPLNSIWIARLEVEKIGNIHDNPELLEVGE